MGARCFRLATAALVALVAEPAAAAGYGASGYGSSGYGAAPAFTQDAWPTALVLRPLTLARDLVEIAAPVGVDLTSGAGRSVSAPVAVHFGATDWLTLGVAHARGLCVSGTQGGCAAASDDLSVDALAQFYAAGPLTAAYGLSLSAAPIRGAVALSGDAVFELRIARDPVAVVLAPRYGFGFTRRDATRVAVEEFPLAGTLPFGASRPLANRETVSAPLTGLVQLGPHVALAAAISVNGVLDPQEGRFADGYHVPVGFAAVVSPIPLLDVGASFTFPNLWGARDGVSPRSEAREVEAFIALRPGARSRRAPALAPIASAPPPAPAAPAAPPAPPAATATPSLATVAAAPVNAAGATPPAAAPAPVEGAQPATPAGPPDAAQVAAPPEPVDAAQAAAPAGTAAPEPAPSPTLVIADLTFTPAILEVVPGATVRVENRDAFPHSVTSESARGAFAPGAVANVQFDTGVFGVGARTFTVPPEAQPGTVIPFYCSVHKGSMRTPDGELRIVERR